MQRRATASSRCMAGSAPGCAAYCSGAWLWRAASAASSKHSARSADCRQSRRHVFAADLAAAPCTHNKQRGCVAGEQAGRPSVQCACTAQRTKGVSGGKSTRTTHTRAYLCRQHIRQQLAQHRQRGVRCRPLGAVQHQRAQRVLRGCGVVVWRRSSSSALRRRWRCGWGMPSNGRSRGEQHAARLLWSAAAPCRSDLQVELQPLLVQQLAPLICHAAAAGGGGGGGGSAGAAAGVAACSQQRRVAPTAGRRSCGS